MASCDPCQRQSAPRLAHGYYARVPVDQILIDEAMQRFGLTAVRDLRNGGQKTVRLVERNGEELVLKVITTDSGLPDALRRAQREVELLQRVDNPHVVKVASELVELGNPVCGAAWLEEYLDGDDLSDCIGTLWSWDEAAAMAHDVATGLAALHTVKVVHRDLSSNNIRRLQSGRFVVMDPGFARHTLRSDLTVGGQPGTRGFLSPEHLQPYSGAPSPASDVFCVGILIFLALSSHLPIPFSGDVADYIAQLSRVETLDLQSFRADLHDEQVALVRRCLHSQPARRPRNGTRLVEALEAVQ
jgi:eukaryotic-like serine/threonine-protein kinase